MKKIPQFLIAFAVAMIFTVPVSADAQGFSDETLDELSERVASLRTKVDESNAMIQSNREKLEQHEINISNAREDTDQLIASLNELAKAYKSGSAYHKTIIKAQTDLVEYIKRFKNGSEVQQQVAKELENTLKTMKEIDLRRDKAVEILLKEIRRLDANKEDIEALIVADNYKKMENILMSNLESLEGVMTETKGFNDSIAEIAGLPTE